jgi:glycosyltransferase involved in cell wall biosynthesis
MESIQQSHCVVLPYHDATQSGVLAAAFAGHRYVIASDVGGLRDSVAHDHNGLRVPPSDSSALASVIRELINDEPRSRRLGRGAAETAQTQLDWNVIADALHREFCSFSKSCPRMDAPNQIQENTALQENIGS